MAFGSSGLPGLSGFTQSLDTPLQGGVGTPGSVARNFSSPLSQGIFANAVRNSQINNLESLGGAGTALRGAIQTAQGTPRPGSAVPPRERPDLAQSFRGIAGTGALRQIADPSFRLGGSLLNTLRGQQPSPPVQQTPTPPPARPGRDPRFSGFFNLPQQPIPGLNRAFGPGGRLGQTLARPQLGQAQQARNAFLAQNPLGNRLRRGLGANFQGQNLFGSGGSRLGEVLRRPPPIPQIPRPGAPRAPDRGALADMFRQLFASDPSILGGAFRRGI